MRTCPKCSLLNPDSAVMCDCGHPFDAAAADAARAEGFNPRHETNPPGPSGAAKFGAGVLGYVAGAFLFSFPLELGAAMGHPAPSGLWGLTFFFGIAGVAVAVRWQKKRYMRRR